MLQTDFEFTLPYGYIDEHGSLHRQGIMRRATALDEVEPLGDPRVRTNDAYLTILLLGRVITRLGSLDRIGPDVVARMFATDFLYLQDLYMRLNSNAPNLIETACPTCGTRIVLDTAAYDEPA